MTGAVQIIIIIIITFEQNFTFEKLEPADICAQLKITKNKFKSPNQYYPYIIAWAGHASKMLTSPHDYPSTLTYPGWKLELKAEAKPGKTAADDGTPAAAAAAAACRGATDATEDGVAPGSPMKEGNTGLPAPGPPETPNAGKAAGLGPGGRPGKMEGAEVRPRPNGDAAEGLGARPG